MAFSVKKFNAKKFDLSPEKDCPYVKLSELKPEETYIVACLYVNKKSKYGDSPVVGIMGADPSTGTARVDALANFPRFQLEAVQAMLDDDEAIAAINAGKVGFTIRTYFSETYGIDCYAAEWVDV